MYSTLGHSLVNFHESCIPTTGFRWVAYQYPFRRAHTHTKTYKHTSTHTQTQMHTTIIVHTTNTVNLVFFFTEAFLLLQRYAVTIAKKPIFHSCESKCHLKHFCRGLFSYVLTQELQFISFNFWLSSSEKMPKNWIPNVPDYHSDNKLQWNSK